jgi:hypothetical protein
MRRQPSTNRLFDQASIQLTLTVRVMDRPGKLAPASPFMLATLTARVCYGAAAKSCAAVWTPRTYVDWEGKSCKAFSSTFRRTGFFSSRRRFHSSSPVV